MWSRRLAFYLFIYLFIISCKSVKVINDGNVSNITDSKLRSCLKLNELEYSKLYLKKVNFSLNFGDKKKSFNGSFVVQKDSFIIVSINAIMGIELVRAKLTKSDVTIIDKFNKSVLKTNYSYFMDKYNLDFSYSMIQAILTNSLFVYPLESDFYDGLKKYKHHTGDSFYSFKSIKDKRIDRLNKRSKNNVLVHELDIYPELYRIFKVFIKDFGTNETFTIDYTNFTMFGDYLFPEHLKLEGKKGNETIKMGLKINYLQINDGGSTHFKIPSSYELKEI